VNVSTPSHKKHPVIIKIFLFADLDVTVFGLPAVRSGGGGIFQELMPLMRRSALFLILGYDDAYSGRIIPAIDRKILPFSLFQKFQYILKI